MHISLGNKLLFFSSHSVVELNEATAKIVAKNSALSYMLTSTCLHARNSSCYQHLKLNEAEAEECHWF